MTLTIGVDVGGTKVAAGVVDERGKIIESLRRRTPAASPAQTEQAIADVVSELLSRHQATAAGIGAAGFVARPGLTWSSRPTSPGAASRCWPKVRQHVSIPVIMENDANASAWAELRYGAARGHDDVVLITVGTGIGGAIIIGGVLQRGRWGMGGEPGHYRVVPDGRLCGCGNRGCWEQYASGNALVAEAREFAAGPRPARRADPAGRRHARGDRRPGHHPGGPRG